MGGNAFKDEMGMPRTVRVNGDTYTRISNGLVDFLYFKTNLLNLSNFDIVESYSSKDSFGDLDFVYGIIPSGMNYSLSEQLIKAGIPEENISVNANVTSFIYEHVTDDCRVLPFQIDAIRHDENTITALEYYNYNDLGNLVGRLAHRIGLKYGHDGLKYIHNDGDNRVFEIVLTTSTKEIYKCLGLDYSRYMEGFKTLEDIFQFVSSSYYFHPDIYLLQNRNHISRVRDAKRKTYQAFLKWCENRFPTIEPLNPMTQEEKSQYKRMMAMFAIQGFGKTDEFNTKMFVHNSRRVLKQKYNGVLVSEITGLRGKELGHFMTNFKSVYPEYELILLSEEEIKDYVEKYFTLWENVRIKYE